MPPSARIYKFVHKNNKDAILYVGYDDFGRVISRIEKAGISVAVDLYVKMPNELELEKQGWIREL